MATEQQVVGPEHGGTKEDENKGSRDMDMEGTNKSRTGYKVEGSKYIRIPRPEQEGI